MPGGQVVAGRWKLWGSRPLTALNTDDVAQWLNDLTGAANTVANKHGFLAGALNRVRPTSRSKTTPRRIFSTCCQFIILCSGRRRSHTLSGEPDLEVVAGVSDKQDRPDVLLRSGIALQLLHDLLALIRRRVEETTQYRPRTR